MAADLKATPGPWRAHEPSVMEVIVYGGNNERVAKVTRFMSDVGIANAHLIAAAPDLYAAAEELKAAFMDGCGNSRPGSAKRKRLQAAGAALDAACRKARGEA